MTDETREAVLARPAVAFGPTAVALAAVGATAVGALAIGALAVGVLGIGRLAVGSGRFKRLEIDELVVGRLILRDED
jgi:hypothetical protein